jgi:hypothetical protein
MAARIAGPLAMVSLVVVVSVVALVSGGARHRTVNPPALQPQPAAGQALGAQLTIAPGASPSPVPHSFLGLSTEYWTLPVDERHITLYKRVISMLHVPGDGPFVLRIGGDSSDHALFDPAVRDLPRWAFGLTEDFIARTARLVHEIGLRVIVDLNLITATPQEAAAWAQEAEAAMPKGSIIGFEVGNEPDLYSRAFWVQATDAVRFEGRALPNDITPASYVRDFNTYSRLLSRVVPHVPLYAPALANPRADLSWIAALLSGAHPGLRVVSGHRYPYSGCTFPGTSQYPTIDRILSENATVGMANSIRPAVVLAHQAGFPFVLTEFNSITCGGMPGVSNTFATALWAPDAVFEMERAGVEAVHLHARQHAINDPFTFDGSRFVARPLLYGLILFARTLGPDAQLVHTQLSSPGTDHLKVWAVKVGAGTLHVLYINKGPREVHVGTRLPATAPAAIQRLLAPSPSAESGVTLGGQSLDQDAQWTGRPVSETVRRAHGEYLVTLPAYSAALLSVPIARGALRQEGAGRI